MRQTGRVRNIRCLIGFELFLKTACLSFFVPIINKMFYFCLWAAGYSYITKENVREFLLSPCVLVAVVLLLIGSIYYLRFEWRGVYCAVEWGKMGRMLSFSDLFFESVKAMRTPKVKKESYHIFRKEVLAALIKKCIPLFVIETFFYVILLMGMIFFVVHTVPEGISGAFLLRLYERYQLFCVCVSLSINIVIMEYVCAKIMIADKRVTVKKEEKEESTKRKKKKIYLWFAYIAMLVFAMIQFLDFFRNRSVVLSETLEQICITAHRGASGTAPENTLSAIRLAIKEGADYAEIDIRMTKDKVPVLLHDVTLARTTDGERKIGNVTYEELCRYEITGRQKTGDPIEKVPRLEDVFSRYGGKIGFNIELKETGNVELAETVIELIEAYGIEQSCVITSTSVEQLEMIKQRNRGIKTGLILSFVFGDFYKNASVDFFSIRSEFISEYVVKKAHAKGKEVHAWTVNEEYEIRRLISVGIDNIITDNPAATRDILQESKRDKSLEGWISLFASKNNR